MGLFDGLFGNKAKSNKKIHSIPFDTQLKIFQNLGFELKPEVDIEDIEYRWGSEIDYETNPFNLLYQTLGQTSDEGTPICDKCWDFDTEAIEDHGAYIEIMKNLERITRAELVFTDIEDYVDIEEDIAWVCFTLNGQTYRWDLAVEDDWVDPALFSKLANLTMQHKTKGRYTYFNTGGQSAVIGYETPAELERIKRETGLDIAWLS